MNVFLVPAHLGNPGQNPESHKTAVCVCVSGSRHTGKLAEIAELIKILFEGKLMWAKRTLY